MHGQVKRFQPGSLEGWTVYGIFGAGGHGLARGESKQRISPITAQPIVFVNQHNAAGQLVAPTP